MNIGFMDLIKCATQGGRRSLARKLANEYLTIDNAKDLTVKGVNTVLDKISNQENLAKISESVELGADICASIAGAIKDGKVTDEEARKIMSETLKITGGLITQGKIDALIDTIVEKIP
jgi:hypothetical protein